MEPSRGRVPADPTELFFRSAGRIYGAGAEGVRRVHGLELAELESKMRRHLSSLPWDPEDRE